MPSNTQRSRLATETLSPAVSLLSVMLFFVCLAAQAAYCYLRPIALFDTMAYVSIANGNTGNNFGAGGRACAAQLPGPHSDCDVIVAYDNFATVASYSPADLATFLRFYRVKPLYTLSVSALDHAFHMNPYKALRIVSSASFFLMGVVVWLWLREYLSWTAASILALLIMNTPSVLDLGKRLLPDGLCTLLMLLAAYLLLYRRPKWIGVLVLILLPLSRTDNIIFAAFLGTALIWLSSYDLKRKATLLAALFAGCVVMQLTLSRVLHSLSYPILFKHSFVQWTDPSSFPGTTISAHEYLHALAVYGSKSILLDMPEALFLAVLALAVPACSRPLRYLLWTCFATLAVRLVLFPGMEVRYYVWFYLIAAIAVCSAMGELARPYRSWFVRPQAEAIEGTV